jgi:3-deoxy-7-phosphoheptulonate synthase
MTVSTIVNIGGVPVGGRNFLTIAGPCAVESSDITLRTALAVQAAGARVLRAGAYKPRTSPRSFQGLGWEGVDILREVKALTGMPVITEVTDIRRLDEVLDVADAVQVGARNMQNYPLLSELGMIEVPVLLKRGLSATVDELLMASEYILMGGNHRVILCERGIRTFESSYRFTLDLGAVAVLRERTQLPVIVDPSHAAGRRALVLPLALAAVGAGADGLIVEVHPEPSVARCDGEQAIEAHSFSGFMRQVRRVARAVGRDAEEPAPVTADASGLGHTRVCEACLQRAA